MEMAHQKSMAVLLTVHNRQAKTIKCLEHLFTQKQPDSLRMDVYLVDDGCTDGTRQAVEKLFPVVNIIQGNGELYWNRGMWTAWDVASKKKKYDYFLWLNDDTYLLENAVVELLILCESYKDKIIVVGASKSSKSDKLTYGGRISNDILKCDGRPCEVKGFDGNIVLVPQQVYMTLGNLDYYYRHGKGDSDYALRARKAGIKMYQCGYVLGICDEHERIDTWCNPDVPFPKRWRAMLEPTGMRPHEWFHYEKKMSIKMATFHFVTILLRCMFPKLWIK